MMSVAEWIETAIASSQTTELAIIVTESTHSNLRWAHNSLTTNGQAHDRSATVIAYDIGSDDVASAVVTGPLPGAAQLTELVHRATLLVADAPRQPQESLAVGSVDANFGDPHPSEQAGIAVLEVVAKSLGETFSQAADIERFFGFAEHLLTTTWLATTTGTRRRHVQPSGRFELNAKNTSTGGSVWVGQATQDFTDVSVSAHVLNATKRLEWSNTKISLPAGRYETILPPSAVADFLICAYWTMNGRDADEGSSVYSGSKPGSNRVGERLAVLPFTMTSDPHHVGLEQPDFAIVTASSGTESVWDNGADIAPTKWLSGGTLESLARTRAGHQATGETSPWAYPTQNLIIDTGSEETLDDMISTTKRGLLLTCLWYIREVDPQTLLLTGLTRDGVYLIEDGQVVGEVNNFRFNESPIDLLRRATQASVAEPTLCREWNDYFLWSIAPGIRVPDFHMSTVSDAV